MNRTTIFINISSTIFLIIFTIIFTLFGVYCCLILFPQVSTIQSIFALSFGFLFYFLAVLTPAPMLIIIYFPIKKIMICDDCVSFQILFKTKQLQYKDIISVTKEKYLSFATKYNDLYDDCLYFVNTKFKKDKRMDLSIPIKKIFCKSDKTMRQRYKAISFFLSKIEHVDKNVLYELEDMYHKRIAK